MIVENKNIEKICSFYVSDFHLEMILMPYINKKLDENKKVIIKTEKNLKDTVEVLISKMNINNENKKEIINLGWNNEYNKEINNDSNIIIIGTEKYIEDINNQINQNNIKDATIIDIKKIINEHDSSLNTLGFYDM